MKGSPWLALTRVLVVKVERWNKKKRAANWISLVNVSDWLNYGRENLHITTSFNILTRTFLYSDHWPFGSSHFSLFKGHIRSNMVWARILSATTENYNCLTYLNFDWFSGGYNSCCSCDYLISVGDSMEPIRRQKVWMASYLRRDGRSVGYKWCSTLGGRWCRSV